GMFRPQGVIRNEPGATPAAAAAPQTVADWQYYGRTPAGTRYAPLTQIDPKNVDQLQVAWTFRTGDIADKGAENQNTPIQIGDTLYVCTPRNKVFALQADTGKERWRFDPEASSPVWQRCRGVGYYETTAAPASGQPQPAACRKRIILSTIDARLIALDADTGKPCEDFGQHGTVDLKQGMGEVKPGYYFQTSAPTVVRNMIVIGGWVFD
ncbi:PQQ-binding-like beta-propeller repeat protein, partial [Bordetella hinzii]|nr:PQQ-binding-like beta-propeller repeat protein [Bordetella hinzii]